jgi:acyl-CoA thioester hydrolase
MHVVKRRIRITPLFHQTDMMGVIHNAQYFLWFEEGRLAIMKEVLSIEEAMRLGFITPVVENRCEYKRSVKFGDPLILFTSHKLVSVYEGRLTFSHSLVHETSKQEMACGTTAVTIVDFKTNKLIKEWPDDLWKRYHSLK